MAARELTFDEMIRLLGNVPDKVRPEVRQAMETNALLAEGQAKINCGYVQGDGPEPAAIPGSAYEPCPYDKPPHETGTLCRGNHGWTREFYEGRELAAFVGNSVQEYNLHVHEGTSRMQARPFLADAVRQQRPNFVRVISAAVARGLERAKQEGA